MMDLLRSRFAFQLGFLKDLVADIPEERFAEMPVPDINTPAWLLGHLCWAADLAPQLLGKRPALDRTWTSRFGAKTRPKTEASFYPTKAELIATLDAAHSRLLEALPLATPDRLAAEMPEPAYRSFIPTIGDAIVHLMTSHESYHTGQLSAWRRAAGLPHAPAMFFA